MHIVFLGNCQLHALQHIFRIFVEPYTGCTTDFVDAYGNITPDSRARLNNAEAAIVQVTAEPPALDHAQIPQRAIIHRLPLVSGAFLWPFQGVEHPLKPAARYGNPPYMPEYCDRYLARLLTDGIAPQEALQRYTAYDAAAAGHVARLYELTLEQQRRSDAVCGTDCAGIIETHCRHEQLFQSAYHFNTRIARYLGATLAERMGFGEAIVKRIETRLMESPFVSRWVPVHASVARHFGLTYVTAETRYPFLWEGGFTFDEYVLRFMEARWSAALQEGVIDARAGKPGAREKLEQGLREAPLSAEGHHELSKLAEKDGDMDAAEALQRRAVQLKPSATCLARLAHLVKARGDPAQAVALLFDATRADPMVAGVWSMLRGTLLQLGEWRQAVAVADEIVTMSADPVIDGQKAARIRKRLEAAHGANSSAAAPRATSRENALHKTGEPR